MKTEGFKIDFNQIRINCLVGKFPLAILNVHHHERFINQFQPLHNIGCRNNIWVGKTLQPRPISNLFAYCVGTPSITL